MMAAVVSRTELVEHPVLIAKLDAAVARHSPKWMRLSGPRLFERIDMWVMRFDPAGKRVPRERTENRYVEIAPTDAGLAGVWAQLHAATAWRWIRSSTRLLKRSARQIREPSSNVGRTPWPHWPPG